MNKIMNRRFCKPITNRSRFREIHNLIAGEITITTLSSFYDVRLDNKEIKKVVDYFQLQKRVLIANNF